MMLLGMSTCSTGRLSIGLLLPSTGRRQQLLTFAAAVLFTSTAFAQSRQTVIPSHEQAKTKADAAYRGGNYDEAVRLVEPVIRSNPRDHVALYLRASARVEIGRAKGDKTSIRSGIADAREAIRLGTSKDSMYYLPYLYGMTSLAIIEDRGEHAEVVVKVVDDLLKRLQLKPDDKANFHYQRGLANTQLKKIGLAAADFENAIKLSPQHLGAFIARADAHASAGQAAEALEAFNAAVDAFPSNPLVFNNRGMFLQQTGKPQDALIDFTKALERDPNYFYARTNLGFALMESGDPATAENEFTASLKTNPNQPMVYSLRGTSKLEQRKLREAITDYTKVVQLDPRNPVARGDLGFAMYFAGYFAEAAQAFGQAMQLDENHRYLTPWRYGALLAADQQAEAAKLAAPSIEKDEDDRDWIDHLMTYLTNKIDEEKLIASVHPTDKNAANAQKCEAYFFIAQRLAAEGNDADAQDRYQKSLDTRQRHLSAYRGSKISMKRTN